MAGGSPTQQSSSLLLFLARDTTDGFPHTQTLGTFKKLKDPRPVLSLYILLLFMASTIFWSKIGLSAATSREDPSIRGIFSPFFAKSSSPPPSSQKRVLSSPEVETLFPPSFVCAELRNRTTDGPEKEGRSKKMLQMIAQHLQIF